MTQSERPEAALHQNHDGFARAHATAQRIVENIQRVIVDKQRAVELAVVAMLCHSHALIEDVPGVGKTMLAKSLARSVGCSFKRIQFTPDLLPTDITGVTVYNQKTGEFEFRPGPVMAQVVLADEINRATPKAQAALLEAMEERQVTAEGVTRPVPVPFMVLATQNPVGYEGTFPLPEAQLDRFLVRISLGYPSAEAEVSILEQQQLAHPFDRLETVATPEELLEAQRAVRGVYVDESVQRYIVALVEATRSHPEVVLGASPRASLGLFRAGQALALLRRRSYVIPDDIKELAEGLLAHRVVVSAAAHIRGVDSPTVVRQVSDEVPVPGARVGR